MELAVNSKTNKRKLRCGDFSSKIMCYTAIQDYVSKKILEIGR